MVGTLSDRHRGVRKARAARSASIPWQRLSMERRCQIVASLARRLADHPLPDFRNWKISGVGFGWRVRESRDGAVRWRAPALILIVPRKIARTALSPQRRIPRYLTIRRIVEGRSVLLHVPIDVRQRTPIAKAHSPGLVSGSGAQAARLGTGCVVLQDKEGKRWLLGCHHVIGDSNSHPTLRPDSSMAFSAISALGRSALGPGRRFGPLSANANSCVDAALARIVGGSPLDSSFWTFYPQGHPSGFAYWSQAQRTPRVFCSGVQVQLRFLGVDFNRPMRYAGGARAGMREVALYEIPASSSRPTAGDSGAPLVSIDGKWLGMYIGAARTTIDGASRRVALVIPPHVILSEPSLGEVLELVD
jgi:hypothetical protein